MPIYNVYWIVYPYQHFAQAPIVCCGHFCPDYAYIMELIIIIYFLPAQFLEVKICWMQLIEIQQSNSNDRNLCVSIILIIANNDAEWWWALSETVDCSFVSNIADPTPEHIVYCVRCSQARPFTPSTAISTKSISTMPCISHLFENTKNHINKTKHILAHRIIFAISARYWASPSPPHRKHTSIALYCIQLKFILRCKNIIRFQLFRRAISAIQNNSERERKKKLRL